MKISSYYYLLRIIYIENYYNTTSLLLDLNLSCGKSYYKHAST